MPSMPKYMAFRSRSSLPAAAQSRPETRSYPYPVRSLEERFACEITFLSLAE